MWPSIVPPAFPVTVEFAVVAKQPLIENYYHGYTDENEYRKNY